MEEQGWGKLEYGWGVCLRCWGSEGLGCRLDTDLSVCLQRQQCPRSPAGDHGQVLALEDPLPARVPDSLTQGRCAPVLRLMESSHFASTENAA